MRVCTRFMCIMYVHAYIGAYIHAYLHTCIHNHAYIHTYIHVGTWACFPAALARKPPMGYPNLMNLSCPVLSS